MGDSAGLTSTDAIGRVLDALMPKRRRRGTVLLGPGVQSCDRYAGPGTPTTERDLIKALRGPTIPPVVVVRTVTVNLLRALRGATPDLLVVLDEQDEEVSAALQTLGTLILGPGAALVVDASALKQATPLITCAHALDELEGLRRAFRERAVVLSLAPTPPWLCDLFEHPDVAELSIAGYVPAEVLDARWARFADARVTPHALVPVGLAPVRVNTDAEQSESMLEAGLAAASLERSTGPIFPAPRVLALVLEGLEQHETPSNEATPQQLAVWAQAVRALPYSGSLAGMRTPTLGLPLEAPTAAFLAQRALLRAEQHAAAVAGPPPVVDFLEEDAIARSSEVLRGAAETLTDQESKVVLRGFGFEVTRQAVANSASGAAGFADRIGYPVVLKALSPDLRRRSDVGGIVLALSTAAAVRRAYAQVVSNIEKKAPTARLDGVLVAEMIGEGLDIRCGGRRLDSGDIVLYAQITSATHVGEPALAAHPLEPTAALSFAHAVIARSSVFALRRSSDPEVRDLAALLLRLSTVFERTADRVVGVDLGPARLAATPRGYVILDARITQRAHLDGL